MKRRIVSDLGLFCSVLLVFNGIGLARSHRISQEVTNPASANSSEASGKRNLPNADYRLSSTPGKLGLWASGGERGPLLTGILQLSLEALPEPRSIFLLGVVLLGLSSIGRRRITRKQDAADPGPN